MRLRSIGVAVVIALSACGSESVDELERCQQAKDDWAALLASLDRGCDDVSECVAIGTLDETCDDLRPSLGSCSGDAVNVESVGARQADVNALEERWSGCRISAYCDDLGGCGLDCNFGGVACQAGQCVTQSSCLE